MAVLSTVISLANFGWYAVTANLFASSMIHLANNFGLGLDKGVWAPILGTLCVLLGTLIALGGPEVIKGTNRFLVVALLFVGLIIVGICFVAVPIRDIMNVQPAIQENLTPIERFYDVRGRKCGRSLFLVYTSLCLTTFGKIRT